MCQDLAWWIVYASTGACQPLLVEQLSVRGLAPQLVLWPMLANCIGLFAVLPMSWALRMRNSKDGSFWPRICFSRHVRRSVAHVAAVDFGSAALLNLALLRCGACAQMVLHLIPLVVSGAVSFALTYSSCTLFVAVLKACTPGGKWPTSNQWLGVLLVTAALTMYAAAGNYSRLGEDDTLSLVLALSGSLGHSYMFVLAEKIISEGQLSAYQLSTAMGGVESAALAAWSCFTMFGLGAVRVTQPLAILHGYGTLSCVDALHALSFFATLGSRGAVSASLLKGVQIILVFSTSQLLFPCYDKVGPRQKIACIGDRAISRKSSAVALMVVALIIFYTDIDRFGALKRPAQRFAKALGIVRHSSPPPYHSVESSKGDPFSVALLPPTGEVR